MLNSIGLANPGRDRFLAETLPRLASSACPLWVSVGGFAADEYAETCARCSRTSPRSSSTSRARTSTRRRRARPRSSPRAARPPRKPLYAKLSPAAWDIAEVARAVEAAGADGLSLVNTIRGLALDPRHAAPDARARRRRLLRTGAEADRARRRLRVRAAVELPIVGMGGVRSGRDALELIAAGASAVALGTSSSRTPTRRPASARSSPPRSPNGTSDIPWTHAASPIRPCK